MHHKDGLAPEDYGTYQYMRAEAHGAYLLPTADELRADGPAHGTVGLRLYYSAANSDNFLGTNASDGYTVVHARSLGGSTNLSTVAATVFATPPNKSFVPMDLYWSAQRKDMQNVASAAARKWLSKDYVRVQRLGWVLSSSSVPSNHGGLMGPCRSAAHAAHAAQEPPPPPALCGHLVPLSCRESFGIGRLGWASQPHSRRGESALPHNPHRGSSHAVHNCAAHRAASGRYGLPSTPNDDPAYRDNSYWRGRVWGPLNLLVYMGLRHPKHAGNEPIE